MKSPSAYLSFRSSSGFTLIEMIVSLSIFSLVMAMSLTALLTVSQAQKQAIGAKNNFDNLSFSLEAMTKEIKAGASFDCIPSTPALDNCPYSVSDPGTGGSALTFINNEGRQVTYSLSPARQLIRQTNTAPCNNAPFFCPISALSVKITRLVFYVSGASLTDNEQPRVTTIMEGQSPGFKPGQLARFNLQTTATPRPLDQ
ncbi:MAG: prepilin-type N-terminal cleavage/methylation domain-containing protein [Patescibacteria group bacterium]